MEEKDIQKSEVDELQDNVNPEDDDESTLRMFIAGDEEGFTKVL